jgi:hypothetical protein
MTSKCERCGLTNTEYLVKYVPEKNEDSGIMACTVCDKKLSKMLKGLHWRVLDKEKDRTNKDYEEQIKSIVAVWKDIPLSKSEKEEISTLK